MMHKLVMIVFLFYFNSISLKAEEYKLEMFFTNNFEIIKFPDKSMYYHVSGTGVWKDSYGDYGNMQCYGRILESKERSTNLDIFCDAVDQNNLKFWLRLARDSDQTDAGVGTTTYLYGEKKYNKLVDKKCIYASKIFGKNAIVNQKCKIN